MCCKNKQDFRILRCFEGKRMRDEAVWTGHPGCCHALSGYCLNFVKSQLRKVNFGKFILVLALFFDLRVPRFYDLVMLIRNGYLHTKFHRVSLHCLLKVFLSPPNFFPSLSFSGCISFFILFPATAIFRTIQA